MDDTKTGTGAKAGGASAPRAGIGAGDAEWLGRLGFDLGGGGAPGGAAGKLASADPTPTRLTFFVERALCRRLPDGAALLTRSVDIELRDRGAGLWAVVADGCGVLNADGDIEHEPSPSHRDGGFLSRTRFPLGDAIRRARDFALSHEVHRPPECGCASRANAARHRGTTGGNQ